MKLSVSSVHPSREFSDLQVELWEPPNLPLVSNVRTVLDRALAIYRLANSVYIEFFGNTLLRAIRTPGHFGWHLLSPQA